jgi:apolipoprotein N-acyltransferase
MAAPAMAAAVAIFVAAPWLDERLVWCEWLGVAAGLMVVPRLRGWWNESWTLAAAVAALAIAFHWTPRSLAAAMQAGYSSGLLAACPVILWDAIRLAAPFLFAARLAASPSQAWLPAGVAAAALEAIWPSVFPWKLGYSQASWPIVVQSVDLFGPEAATFVLFAHAGAVVWAVHAAGLARPAVPSRAAAAAAVVCLLNLAYGWASLALWEDRIARAPTLGVTLAQVDPADDDGIATLRSLTTARRAAAEPPDLVCWPECSGGVFDLGLESLADRDRVAQLSRPGNGGARLTDVPTGPLLFGGILYEGHPDYPAVLRQSAVLIDAEGTIRGRYHKRHLMPFGEYVPFADIWPDLRQRFPLADDFTAGKDANVLDCGSGARLGVMLCYEDMVPAAARSLVRQSANVLVVLINGASFTAETTLRQHRQLARLRAVECRRCLLRCAATGETCVISPVGTIDAALPLHSRGTLDARVPLIDAVTLSSRVGPLFPALCGMAAVAMLAVRRRAATISPAARP